MTRHAMIDIETLDTSPTSLILSVGACIFDPYSDTEPHSKTTFYPSVEEQFEYGRTVSDATLAWWKKQDVAILEASLTEDNRCSLASFAAKLNKFLVAVDKIWCQGPQFDMVIIENLFGTINHHRNWKYWQIMDSRTLFQLMPEDPRRKIQQNLHDPAEDAYWQAVCVQQCFSHFSIKKR